MVACLIYLLGYFLDVFNYFYNSYNLYNLSKYFIYKLFIIYKYL